MRELGDGQWLEENKKNPAKATKHTAWSMERGRERTNVGQMVSLPGA